MEIKISSKQMLKFLHILSWIVFIGLCVEAGSFVYNAISSSFYPLHSDYFGLSELYNFDYGYFLVILLLMFIPATMKAILFYLIVDISSDKGLKISQPFNENVKNFIVKSTYLAFGIGMFTLWGMGNTEHLASQGVSMPNIQQLNFDGGDVWLFMGVILLIIVQMFKKGIELQTENELTI